MMVLLYTQTVSEMAVRNCFARQETAGMSADNSQTTKLHRTVRSEYLFLTYETEFILF